MSKKTIYWIVGIILFLSYYSCKSSWLASHPMACGWGYGEDGQRVYTAKTCGLWRTLGLIKCVENSDIVDLG